jgi:Polyketide cyclase / dehydrase and lipid transport
MPDAIRSVTGSIESDARPEIVVGILRDGSRIPEWAPAFADTVTPDGEAWRATRAGSDFTFTVIAVGEAGTVDYVREIAPGVLGGAYLRAVPRPGGGSVITMTLPVRSGVDPDESRATLTAELIGLEALASVHAEP